MAFFLLFTFIIVLPFFLAALSHLWSALFYLRNQRLNNLPHPQEVPNPLCLHPNQNNNSPCFSIQDKRRISTLKKVRTSMDEKSEQKPIRRKSSLQHLDAEEAQKHANAQGTSGHLSPTHPGPSPSPSPLKKSSSTRSNCLCSPTTHVGSFRCRLHRHGSNFRRGHSVGSDLSELANKFSSKPSNLTASSLQMH